MGRSLHGGGSGCTRGRPKSRPAGAACPHSQSFALYAWSDPSPVCPYCGLPALYSCPFAIHLRGARGGGVGRGRGRWWRVGCAARSAGAPSPSRPGRVASLSRGAPLDTRPAVCLCLHAAPGPPSCPARARQLMAGEPARSAHCSLRTQRPAPCLLPLGLTWRSRRPRSSWCSPAPGP